MSNTKIKNSFSTWFHLKTYLGDIVNMSWQIPWHCGGSRPDPKKKKNTPVTFPLCILLVLLRFCLDIISKVPMFLSSLPTPTPIIRIESSASPL